MHPPTESLLLRRSLGIALLALAAFLPSCRSREIERAAPAELGLSEEKLAELRADISTLVEEERIPGAAMLVVRDGKLAWLDTVGFANVAREEPLAGDSIFRICSMTKPVTSVAAMILVEEGKLALDDPVSRYIPEFANVEVGVPEESDGATVVKTVPLEQPLTVRHLLTHTSGLTYTFMGNGWINQAYREAGVNDGLVEAEGTCADNVRKLATVPLLFQPGSRWNYGLSTDVLGRVVEVASGRTLEQFFEERIFSPLGMRDTHFRLPRGKRDRIVSAYQPRSDDDPRIVPLPDGPVRRGGALYSATYPLSGSEHFSGGAGLVSTITDYARFLLMLEQKGELDGVRILSPESVALMTQDHCADLDVWIGAHGDGFGLGFGVVTDKGSSDLGSPGTFSWGGFYYTYFFVDPQERLIGVFMSQLYPWGDLDAWATFRRGIYNALEAKGDPAPVQETASAGAN